MLFTILRCKNNSLQMKSSLASLSVLPFQSPDTMCKELLCVNSHVCLNKSLLNQYPEVCSVPDAVGEQFAPARK